MCHLCAGGSGCANEARPSPTHAPEGRAGAQLATGGETGSLPSTLLVRGGAPSVTRVARTGIIFFFNKTVSFVS